MSDIYHIKHWGTSYSTFYGVPYLHLNLSSTLSFHGDDPNCVRRIDFQGWFHFIHQEVILKPQIAVGLVTFRFTLWRERNRKRSWLDNVYSQSASFLSMLQLQRCLTTWTSLAALSCWFYRMLAWVLAGACDAFTVLKAISASAQDAFQDLPQNWMPHVSMRVRLAIV